MIKPLNQYNTILFDCDGVILDSNKVKSNAFYTAALPYGEENAEKLLKYHVQNGGVSRYIKFEYFLREIIGLQEFGDELENLLSVFSNEVKSGLISCNVVDGLEKLRKQSTANWMIVSGGDQSELREVFSCRSMKGWFNAGIFGSPDSKEILLNREIIDKELKESSLFFGDSYYDHMSALKAKIDFVFVSGWTEFSGWQEYVRENSLPVIKSLSDLIAMEF